jgi:hypothetical protein
VGRLAQSLICYHHGRKLSGQDSFCLQLLYESQTHHNHKPYDIRFNMDYIFRFYNERGGHGTQGEAETIMLWRSPLTVSATQNAIYLMARSTLFLYFQINQIILLGKSG